MLQHKKTHKQEQNSIKTDFQFENNPSEDKFKYSIPKRILHAANTEPFNTPKSGIQTQKAKNKELEQTIKCLEQENSALKSEIINLRTQQFMTINEQKLKEMLHENEQLKNEVQLIKGEMEKYRIQNEFLNRVNVNMRNECRRLNEQLKYLKNRFQRKYDNAAKYYQREETSFDTQKSYNLRSKSISYKDLITRKNSSTKQRIAKERNYELNQGYYHRKSKQQPNCYY